jgi:phage terminase small subunit
MALSDKQERFCREYVIDSNATQAAIRAGYSKKTAQQQSSRLLLNVVVAERIVELTQAVVEKLEITQEAVLEELAKIGFSNMQDFMGVTTNGDPYLDLSNLTREQAAAISEFTVDEYTEGRGEDARDVKRIKVKLHNKQGALVDIGRHLGMFPNKVELTGKNGDPVKVDVRLETALEKVYGDSGT